MSVGVRFESVCVALGGRPVVEDASFEIRPGERTAFVGPNGGGKTTIIRMLLGILRPDRGRVVFFEEEPRDPAAAHRFPVAALDARLGRSALGDAISWRSPSRRTPDFGGSAERPGRGEARP